MPAPALNKPHLSRSTAPLSSLVHMHRPLLIFLTTTTTPHVLAPPKPSPPPRSGIPPLYDLDAKWDACLDLSIRRVAYASLVGAFGRPHPLLFCGEKARRKFGRPCQICASIMGIGWGPWSPVLGSYMQATLIAGTSKGST